MQLALDHDRIFGALGDATRRDIVRRAIDGEEGVAQLASHYPMSFAAVQKHVAVLERAGLVHKHRIGRRKVVRTNLEALRMARRLLDRYEEPWRERVERMDQLLERIAEGGRPMTVTAVRKDPESRTLMLEAEFDASASGSGSSGRIPASWSAGGDHRRTRRRWMPTTFAPAAGSSTT